MSSTERGMEPCVTQFSVSFVCTSISKGPSSLAYITPLIAHLQLDMLSPTATVSVRFDR